ncbi:uncharacterized protein [Triticum aestivum]|uniref:uncharacterized protein isoform X2 n=1 Tax=Triticum aestivum TaxID=4565 RepID=UPI001D002710|nr:uncharacterized protein LOC123067558 isoform X2 [Triticum aestivum]
MLLKKLDEVEVARMAAINKEIKCVLTEVLLKVNDDLFNEIAAKQMRPLVSLAQRSLVWENHKSRPQLYLVVLMILG